MLDEMLGEDELKIAERDAVSNIVHIVRCGIRAVVDVDPPIEVNGATADVQTKTRRQPTGSKSSHPFAPDSPPVTEKTYHGVCCVGIELRPSNGLPLTGANRTAESNKLGDGRAAVRVR